MLSVVQTLLQFVGLTTIFVCFGAAKTGRKKYTECCCRWTCCRADAGATSAM